MAMGRSRTVVLAAAVVTALVAQTRAEMLHVNAKECPGSLPRQVCFDSDAARAVTDWTGLVGTVHLPLPPTLAYVRGLLQTTLEVEHSTIPLYLTTMYSIINTSSFAYSTMRSVVMEEMLHMVNAANAINAIGGSPNFDHPDFLPKYPLVLPQLNMSADIVWFTQSSVEHYQILESTPPGGYTASISAAYDHIVKVLTALVHEHGESAVFIGNHSLQVPAVISSGQSASPIYTLADARAALLGVADQGGGCPIEGKPWPMYSNISAGAFGGVYSHAARYEEILLGREYNENDVAGDPTGDNITIDWLDVLRFAPNPSVSDFLPDECVAGGSWVVRNDSFFVRSLWNEHAHHLATSNETSWQDCARKCENWTIANNKPLEPCAMWTWRNGTTVTVDGGVVAANSCLLAQGGGPGTTKVAGFMSGCQFGTVCNQSLPTHLKGGDDKEIRNHRTSVGDRSGDPPNPALMKECTAIHQRGLDFASNYTAMLVGLHNVFNGDAAGLYATISQMYTLKTLAIALMQTPDPRIPTATMGVGPPWEYIPSASQYEARKRLASGAVPPSVKNL
eukprot:m.116319 g.116319  ORF g.116319 m.116319 type:complete len:564 (+) comp21621_c0_seq1:118-1809(+)